MAGNYSIHQPGGAYTRFGGEFVQVLPAAPPRPRLRLASRLSGPAFLAGRRRRSGNGRSPCSLSSGQRARHSALPLRHRHGYAARCQSM